MKQLNKTPINTPMRYIRYEIVSELNSKYDISNTNREILRLLRNGLTKVFRTRQVKQSIKFK